jgi:hypothetical protein
MLLFNYTAKNKVYRGSYTSSYFEMCPDDRSCIGQSFKVTYSVEDPDVCYAYFGKQCK